MLDVLQILKRKELWIPYLKKYSRRYVNKVSYNTKKKFGIDPLDIDISRLQKYLKRNSGSLTYKYVTNHMQCSFLCEDFESSAKKLKADKDFMSKLEMTANNVCNKKFLVLGREFDCVYNKNTEHYRWHDDIIADYSYVLSHYSLVRAKNNVPGVDIKNVWELSRMQYLFAPALFWRLTGDEKAAKIVISVIEDWINCNGLEEGPNWNIAMEAGIRVSNMILAFQLISNYEGIDDCFIEKIVASVYQHMNFILRNEENVAGRTSNHYLGGLLGLLAVSSTFTFLPNANFVYEYARQSFEIEIEKQILSDGGGFEGSTAYQRLVGEMFSLAAIVMKNTHTQVSKMYFSRIEAIADYASAISKTDGSFPQIGDNDGGRIFQLFKEKNNSNAFMVSLASAFIGKIFYQPLCKEVLCFVKRDEEGAIKCGETLRVFPESRHALYKAGNIYCILTAGDAHRFDMGGHVHNDKLSFELMYKGKNFIVDPGSGCYTSYPDIRKAFLSIKQHSTIQIGNFEQNISHSPFSKIKNSSTTNEIFVNGNFDKAELNAKISVFHDNVECIQIRKILIDKDSCITIEDCISSAFTQKCICRYVLHPDVSVEIIGNTAKMENDGISIVLKAPDVLHCSEGLYSDNYGQWKKTQIIWCEIYNRLPDVNKFYTQIEFLNDRAMQLH
ncbi:alginate lyase family protein [Ruminiclostridium herbifermentans]|uniref:Alginate lyase family protein n=1 Tax=Ruminiclostridium herbifermentans TaxID=2488810 RepID=A0A4U7JE97_9FIRM|nr:heparinase II/III family protein [Ruminiclostridium herbifermentans]QNU66795.1 alginate lyase family protein [Ruminiclostridium herbifermentans]